jgi:hypothetical protein
MCEMGLRGKREWQQVILERFWGLISMFCIDHICDFDSSKLSLS